MAKDKPKNKEEVKETAVVPEGSDLNMVIKVPMTLAHAQGLLEALDALSVTKGRLVARFVADMQEIIIGTASEAQREMVKKGQ